MNIHEYQAKDIFEKYGLPVSPRTNLAAADLTLESIEALKFPAYVVKAQIHAGGRGKSGGVKLFDGAAEAFECAKQLVGTEMATYQTAGVKKPIDSVLVEESRKIENELYVAITLDREKQMPVVICSEAGGMDIEEVARTTPEKIVKVHFDVNSTPDIAETKAVLAGFFKDEGAEADRLRSDMAGIVAKLGKLFLDLDATLLEVNPLGLMADGTLHCIDAKINFDDNALFRHPEIAELRDARQEDERENEAKKYDLSYVGLEGSIGCMVNGAGLAMATMDIIKLFGGEPANFLDVGGGASKEKVAAAFKIILKDPRVKVILVNIFGGIMRCDVLAEGIVAAQKEIKLKVPLIVRLEGTNVEQGRKILETSDIDIITATTFEEGAEKAVKALR